MSHAQGIREFFAKNGRLFAVFTVFVLAMFLQSIYCSHKLPAGSSAEFGLWSIFAYGCIVFLLALSIYHSNRFGINAIFLLCLIGAGLLCIFIIGPIKAPDEKTHYLISYWYSNHILGNFQDGLPMRVTDKVFFEQWSQEYGEYAGQFFMLASGDPSSDTSIDLYRDQYVVSPLTYSPQAYFASALGLSLGRLIGLGGVGAYYAGRVFQFAAFAACSYVALRNTPIGKPVFAIIPLFPLVLEQAASFSYDAPIIGMASILTAFCFKAVFEKGQQSKSTLITIAVFSFLLVPCKVVYSVISLLVFAIPLKSFSSKRFAHAFKAGVILVCLVTFALTRLAGVAAMATAGTTGADGEAWRGYSLGDFVGDPFLLIELLVNTFFSYTNQYVLQLCNTSLGALNLTSENAIFFGIAYFLVLAFGLLGKSRDIHASTALKAICMGAFIAATLAIAASLLVGWTFYGSTRIEGIQGRYFYPLVFLLIPLFVNSRFSDNSINGKALAICCLGLDFLYSLNVYSFILLAE